MPSSWCQCFLLPEEPLLHSVAFQRKANVHAREVLPNPSHSTMRYNKAHKEKAHSYPAWPLPFFSSLEHRKLQSQRDLAAMQFTWQVRVSIEIHRTKSQLHQLLRAIMGSDRAWVIYPDEQREVVVSWVGLDPCSRWKKSTSSFQDISGGSDEEISNMYGLSRFPEQ